jgi:hypothetical protein
MSAVRGTTVRATDLTNDANYREGDCTVSVNVGITGTFLVIESAGLDLIAHVAIKPADWDTLARTLRNGEASS